MELYRKQLDEINTDADLFSEPDTEQPPKDAGDTAVEGDAEGAKDTSSDVPVDPVKEGAAEDASLEAPEGAKNDPSVVQDNLNP